MKFESSVTRYEPIEASVLTNGDAMNSELIMAKRTKYDSMFDGDKWYQQQARKAFSILVQRAKVRETITYKELGEALGLNKYFVSLGTVFSSISTTLADLQASWQGGDIPLITNLVTKTNGHPNQFVCAQLTGDPKKAPTQEEYDAVLEVIYRLSRLGCDSCGIRT